MWSPSKPDRHRLVSWLVVGALVAGMTWAIAREDGYATAEPELHDAGVWVTRADQRRIGRLNTEIAAIDTSLSVPAADFEVLQAGADVFVLQVDPPLLQRVDPATAELVPGPALPPDAQVATGGGTAAVWDPGRGRLHVVAVSDLLGLDLEAVDTGTEVAGDAVVTVGTDGTAHLLRRADATITSYVPGPDGARPTGEVQLDLDATGGAQLTAVGDVPVALADGAVQVAGLAPAPVDDEGAVLQRPGPADGSVAVALPDGLVVVPLRAAPDAEPGSVPVVDRIVDGAGGLAAAPVVAGGCRYAAWGGDGLVARQCGDAPVETRRLDRLAGGTSLRWRTNRGRAVLNELDTGQQLLWGDAEPVFVDEWSDALSDEAELTDDQTEQSTEVVREQVFDRTQNRPPTARDDEAGTRVGRPVVVRPLRNDTDPDGDVLLVTTLDEIGGEDSAQVVEDGRAVLVTLDPGRSSPLRLGYEITDGRGGADTGQITVAPVADGNRPPQPGTDERSTVVTGGAVTHDVVAGAFDPDGDPVSLVSATTEDGQVQVDPSGRIAFTATNTPGEAVVEYVLADDRGGRGSGTLAVQVVPREVNEPPVARPDSASTVVGREVVVDLLANDTDANGDDVSLVRVEPLTGATVRWDPTSPEVRFSTDRPGSHVFLYRITDGTDTAESLLRIDVRELGSQFPPVAVRDDVLLRPGQPVFADVLANDVDQDGEVLVVTGVQVPADAPLDVVLVRRQLLRIEATAPLTEAVEFDYRVSDGATEAVGRVVVAPAPELPRNQPPVVRPDEFKVRAGGIATLDVLANDEDPDGDRIELVAPDDVDDATAARDGRLFLADGQLRYQAPDDARQRVVLRSTVADTAENVASAQLVIEVLPADGANRPPVAPTLTARVLAGGRVTITVPLGTADPDGDAVTLEGIAAPPGRGSIAEVGADEIVYEADDTGRGTDQFRYRVRDAFGAEATGTVLVGIAPRSTTNSAPVAADDEVSIVPGATAVVPALDNDSDPDGDPIALAEDDDVLPVANLGEVEVRDGRVVYTAPADAVDGGQTSFRYTIDDGRGARDTATVTVTFDDDRPNRPPVPFDDRLQPQQPNTLITTAPLQSNDTDPDGDELSVASTSLGPEATVNPDGSVTLQLDDEPLQFTYLVSDGVEQRRAAVTIPLVGGRPPVPLPDDGEVVSGDAITLDVLANDSDPDGDDLVLLAVEGVRHGSAEVDGDQVVFTASEAGYAGDAGFAYLVGDGPDPATANTALGFATVRVLPPPVTPDTPAGPDEDDLEPVALPTFTTLPVSVPQGATRTLDVAAAVDAADGAELTYDGPRGATGAVAATLDGTTLTIIASLDAQPGSSVPLTVTVSDGREPVEGTIDVTVTGSDAPLPTTVPDTGSTIQGRAVTVPVLANDVDPVGEGLTVTEVTGIEGVTATTDGTTVTVAPDPDRRDVGQVTLTYTVADATGDTTRQVTGTLEVTVIGRPDVPAAPSCIGGESNVVQISWAAPNANGARITEYRVRVRAFSGGGATPSSEEVRTFAGGATVQTIDGLANGVAHTFEVAAINEAVVDAPEFSQPSPRCVPDQVPDRPEAPSTTFGDEELAVSFAAPPSDGSPVRELRLTNTTTGESVQLGPSQTDYVWTGLENGTAYRFTLTATNDLGESDTSPQSTGDPIPAGTPGRPVAPTTQSGDRFVTVDWTEPDTNGAPILEYRIVVFRQGTQQGAPISVSDPSRGSIQVDTDNGVDYEFRVGARNKAGWGNDSQVSDVVVSAGRPFAVGSLSASEGNTESVLTFRDPDDNGAAITGYEVSVNGGGWQALAGDRTIRGLTNGSDYSFRVRARNSEGAGDASPTSNTINPYGPPNAPSFRFHEPSTLRVNWAVNSNGDNGRPITGWEYSLDGGAWQTQAVSDTTWSFDPKGHNVSTLRVRAVAAGADNARRRSTTIAQDDHVHHTITLSKGDPSGVQPGCTSSACSYVVIQTVTPLFPNRTYSFRLVGTDPAGDFGSTYTFTTNSSGHYRSDDRFYYGHPGECVRMEQITLIGSNGGRLPHPTTNCVRW